VKVQDWIFSVRYGTSIRDSCRRAVVGPARASTVEAALHLAGVPEAMRAEIRAHQVVRDFVDAKLDPEHTGYYVSSLPGWSSWVVCIGPVHEVMRSEDPR
jgi:hypothetical protein